MAEESIMPPTVPVPSNGDAPVTEIKPAELRSLGQKLSKTFKQYAADRKLTEDKWLRSLRQYLGVYDPEIAKELSSKRSRAYPRITRVKCISVVSRVMNLMFPGNEKNWTLKASPSPDMDPEDVQQAVQDEMQKTQEAGGEQPEITEELVRSAVQELAAERARLLENYLDDQLQEIGGDQSLDYVALNRKVVQSGVLYGLGVVRGPFVRQQKRTMWVMDENGRPAPQTFNEFKPQFEFLPVWDYYPDMSAKTLREGDGYFVRLVMSKSQLRKLANREDFFDSVIKKFIGNHQNGNYKAREFETELRTMGTKSHVNEETPATGDGKYEVIVWHGPVSAARLMEAGVDVADSKKADDVEAEVWMLGDHVIKAEMNPWKKLGVDIRTVHTFQFDEDDTSPVGNGLPHIMRDSQMSICAATRMLMDNASITCGPNLEINTDLMRADQDLTSTEAYKIWYREGMGAESGQAAIRNIQIDGHMDELMSIIQMFMEFSDTETFVGPATGGDMERGYSEPMRTAAGASMMRGDAALPFKDIVRNFDQFTQSAITSLVAFNRKFNPDKAPAGDYNVVVRGATSLIAKEVRGMQVDQLASTLSETERMHVDERKLVEARLNVRDMGNLLLSEREVERARAAMQKQAQDEKELEYDQMRAEIRKALADAFQNIAKGQKDMAGADATTMETAIKLVDTGLEQLDAAEELEQPQPAAAAGGAGPGLAGPGGQQRGR